MKDYKINVEYLVNGKKFNMSGAECDYFKLAILSDGENVRINIVPNTPVRISKFEFVMPFSYQKEDKIFVNGYQSWTDSLEYSVDQSMSELSKSTERMLKYTLMRRIGIGKSGDLFFKDFPRQKGVFYGWSFGYVRRENKVKLFASISERSGFTCVEFNVQKGVVTVGKDLEGVNIDKETEVLNFAVISDEYDAAFDRWFALQGIVSRETKKRNGYTTWYNYYSRIDENVVKRDLESLSKFDARIDCFQIDDGYQQAIGDWLITDKNKFPNGMKAVADAIHEKGMLAGLWLAPFAGVKKSKLYKAHRDWFIKSKYGRPYNTGHNWGGFYSLDIYNEGVREYLKHVFDVVLNDWGYDLVKLDFLYGACIRPMYNKTRGEIMCDAMDLIRECCGDKLVLGCGVPLMPAFGKVDYCRIGADIALSWEHRRNIPREDVSTPHAICNSIFRRCLNGRAWMNDPDVFLLRKTNIHLDEEQRKLTSVVNSTFGSLLFTSDNVADYDEDQAATLKEAFREKDIKIVSADMNENFEMKVVYIEDGEEKKLSFNASNGRITGA